MQTQPRKTQDFDHNTVLSIAVKPYVLTHKIQCYLPSFPLRFASLHGSDANNSWHLENIPQV